MYTVLNMLSAVEHRSKVVGTCAWGQVNIWRTSRGGFLRTVVTGVSRAGERAVLQYDIVDGIDGDCIIVWKGCPLYGSSVKDVER